VQNEDKLDERPRTITIFSCSAMGTPSKKRKLNSDSKRSPGASRGLDYFFGKQKQNLPKRPSSDSEQKLEDDGDSSELTDEQFARKLQAQWNQEETTARPLHKYHAVVDSDRPVSSTSLQVQALNTAVTEHLDGDIGASLSEVQPDGKANSQSVPPKSKNTLSLQSTGSAEDAISSNIPLDESPLTFEPSTYVAELQGHWAAEGGDASYALLTRCFVLVSSTRSRIKIVDTLVNLLRVIIEGDPSSLLPTVRTNILLVMSTPALVYDVQSHKWFMALLSLLYCLYLICQSYAFA
jgi:DNA ligase-1